MEESGPSEVSAPMFFGRFYLPTKLANDRHRPHAIHFGQNLRGFFISVRHIELRTNLDMPDLFSRNRRLPIRSLCNVDLQQGRATFSERGPDETFRSSSWVGVANGNNKMRMYNTMLKEISTTAGAACHEEVCQCPTRWMSSTTEECH